VQREECRKTETNKWIQLPDEIVEMILVLASKGSVATFNNLSLTCSRFNAILQGKRHDLLPCIYIQFSDKEFQMLSRYNGKIKITARKIVKLFGEHSGVSLFISKVANSRKWKSSTLLLEPENHSMFRIRRSRMKTQMKCQAKTNSGSITIPIF